MKLIRCVIFLAVAASAYGQFQNNTERSLNCDQRNNRGDRDRGHACEMREYTIPSAGRMDADSGVNGGVSIKGWNRNDVLVRAQVSSWAPSDGEARSIVSQVNVVAPAGMARATGPQMNGDRNWSVSFEIFVPWNTDLKLKTHNGGVHISDVKGNIEFDVVNGGAHLNRLAGNVVGKTVNGGLHIELEGDRWDGNQLNAQTTNGGVHVTIPSNYSARVETGTVNGGMKVDFPVNVQGDLKRNLTFTLGNGGATVRAVTTNGGVTLNRRS